MSSITIYHNPKCSKSRRALAYLEENGHDITVVEYLKKSLDKKTIEFLVEALGEDASQLVRSQDPKYREAGFDPKKELSESEVIEILTKCGSLMQRPLVVKEKKVVIARPEPEEVLENI